MKDPYLPERRALIAAVSAGRGRIAPAVRGRQTDATRGDGGAWKNA
jgi:hypothetical protein